MVCLRSIFLILFRFIPATIINLFIYGRLIAYVYGNLESFIRWQSYTYMYVLDGAISVPNHRKREDKHTHIIGSKISCLFKQQKEEEALSGR